MKRQILSIVGIMACSLAATANSGTRGGGNAIVCFDNQNIPKEIRAKDAFGNILDGSIKDEYIPHITKVEMLDLYQAQVKKGLNGQKSQLIEPLANESFEQYARRILSRVKGLTLWLDKVAETIDELPADRAEMYSYGIEPVNDYNIDYRIDTTNCVVGTIALNSKEGNSYRLAIDERLMMHPAHTRLSQYVTYLHEVVYRTGKDKFGENDESAFKNAVLTRQIVAALIKKETTNQEILNLTENLFYGDLASLAGIYLPSITYHESDTMFLYLLGIGEADKYVVNGELKGFKLDLAEVILKKFPEYNELNEEVNKLKTTFDSMSEDERNQFYDLGKRLNVTEMASVDTYQMVKLAADTKTGSFTNKSKKSFIAQAKKLLSFYDRNEKVLDINNFKKNLNRRLEIDFLKGILYSINNRFTDKQGNELFTIKAAVTTSELLNQSEKETLLANMEKLVQSYISENKTLDLRVIGSAHFGNSLNGGRFEELIKMVPQIDGKKQLPVK